MVFMQGSYWNEICSAFKTEIKWQSIKTSTWSSKNHELLDTKSCVIKKNIQNHTWDTTPVPFTGEKESTHKSGIHLNNLNSPVTRKDMWCCRMLCATLAELCLQVNTKHNGIQPIMYTPSQMTRGVFGVCHSQTSIVAVSPRTSP